MARRLRGFRPTAKAASRNQYQPLEAGRRREVLLSVIGLKMAKEDKKGRYFERPVKTKEFYAINAKLSVLRVRRIFSKYVGS